MKMRLTMKLYSVNDWSGGWVVRAQSVDDVLQIVKGYCSSGHPEVEELSTDGPAGIVAGFAE